MKENYTHISVVLDSSGSMASIYADTIGGFNTFLEAQQEAEGEATFSLAKFADDYHPNWWAAHRADNVMTSSVTTNEPKIDLQYDFANVADIAKLDKSNYTPSGGTPLLDTIAVLIKETGKKLAALDESERPAKVLFVVITDGEENCSCKYRFEDVKALIEEQTNTYKWEFMFLGANQDAIFEAAKMGISAMKSMSYAATSQGVGDTYQMLATKTSAFRSVGVSESALHFTEEERKTAMGEK